MATPWFGGWKRRPKKFSFCLLQPPEKLHPKPAAPKAWNARV